MMYLATSSDLGGVLSPSFTHLTARKLGYTPDAFNSYGWIVVEKDEVWLSNALCANLESLYRLIDAALNQGFTVRIPSTTINLKIFVGLEEVGLGHWDSKGVYTISVENYPSRRREVLDEA